MPSGVRLTSLAMTKTRRSLRFLLAASVGCISVTAAHAQTPAPAPQPQTPTPAAAPAPALTLSGAFEGFYEWNTNRPPDRVNQLRAYDTRANTFGLQQAALVVESAPNPAEGRRAGLRLDLQFGQATETVQGSAANEPRPDVYRHVWQAYGSYVLPWHSTQVDFGKFASNLGYETNYAKDNNNFSRSYLFNFLPFYHMGLRTTVPVNDKVTLMYMLTNGIQQTEEFNNFKSNHFTAILKPASALTWTTSYYFGQEQADHSQPDGPDGWFRVFDTYASWNISPSFAVGADVNHTSSTATPGADAATLTGIAGYARRQLGRNGAIAVRYEHLNDAGGLFGGVEQTLQELTLTAEHTFSEGFLLRAEYRHDWSNKNFFNGPAVGDLRGSQPTALIGLVWWMGDKKGPW